MSSAASTHAGPDVAESRPEIGATEMCRAFFEMLEEEQERARMMIRAQGRRNAGPGAVDDMVQRVFFWLAHRTMEMASRGL